MRRWRTSQHRRENLLAMGTGGTEEAPARASGDGRRAIVMLHGAFSGAWSFDLFRAVFAEQSWDCHAADLIGHGADKPQGDRLAGISLARYMAQIQGFLPQFVATSPNRIPRDRQRAVFDQFGPDSGQAWFELFFSMLDTGRAAAVDTDAVRCPLLCVRGTDDRVVSHGTARATAAAHPGSAFWEPSGHGHMLLVEPGAATLAGCIARWAGKHPC